MANKILKSLTIDGTTMDIHAVEEYTNTQTKTVTANVSTEITSVTVTEPGVYIVMGGTYFATTPTTGDRLCEISLADTRFTKIYAKGDINLALTAYVHKTDNSSLVLPVKARSSVSNSVTAWIKALKIIDL